MKNPQETWPLALLLRKLAAQRIGSAAARATSATAEHVIMTELRRGGLAGVKALVRGANAQGMRLAPVAESAPPPARALAGHQAAGRGRALAVRVMRSGAVMTVSVRVGTTRTPSLTPAALRRAALHAAFYEQYNAAARREASGRRPSGRDRCVLLVAEFEADINNGGFLQYLENKGRRRAQSAHAALRTVGAVHSARLLEQALRLGTRATDELDRLTSRFLRAREDLGSLVMRRCPPPVTGVTC